MAFTLICYYTKNSEYEKSANLLYAAATALGVQCYFLGIDDRGSWGKNTEYKAEFVLDCLGALDTDIAYTDADSMIHAYPSLFENVMDCDMLVRCQNFPWHKNEFLSGTFCLRNTPEVKRMVQEWVKQVLMGKTVRNDSRTWEQYKMGRAIMSSGIKWKQLPVEYICFDLIEGAEGKVESPVITHYQYSRKYAK